jgi:two-component system nitrate/nitrite response regulator NarL
LKQDLNRLPLAPVSLLNYKWCNTRLETAPPLDAPLPAAPAIKVLLVDDHAMFRDGMARLLEQQAGVAIAGQCSSSSEALGVLQPCGANMVLLDVDLGSERALDFVLEARKRGFEGQVLVVTAGVSGPEAVQLVRSGVAGILHKQHSGEVLCEAVAKVAGGGVWLEDDYLQALFHSVDLTKTHGRPQLTEREKDILRFIFRGMTNKEIGGVLQLSESAVKASLRQLFDKLGARTRAQLVKVALEQYREQL